MYSTNAREGMYMGKKKKYSHKIKTSGVMAILPALIPCRTEAEVWFQDNIDITNLLTYLEKKNKGKEKGDKTTVFHCFIAALTKMVHERPKTNNYLKNLCLYQREEISFSFVIKTHMDDKAREELITYFPKLTGNIDDITNDIIARSRKVRSDSDKKKKGFNFFDFYAKLPRIFKRMFIGLFRFLDHYQLLPRSYTRTDGNFTTFLLSNLGSIKSKSVYHHLNNFGNNSLMMTIGLIHKQKVLQDDGSEQIRDMVDIGLTIDERIADGFYLAKSFKVLTHIFQNPELLDEPLENPSRYEY